MAQLRSYREGKESNPHSVQACFVLKNVVSVPATCCCTHLPLAVHSARQGKKTARSTKVIHFSFLQISLYCSGNLRRCKVLPVVMWRQFVLNILMDYHAIRTSKKLHYFVIIIYYIIFTIPHHTTPHHITSHHITPNHITSHHITSQFNLPRFFVRAY